MIERNFNNFDVTSFQEINEMAEHKVQTKKQRPDKWNHNDSLFAIFNGCVYIRGFSKKDSKNQAMPEVI
jgi:hypothetical protein